MSIQLQALPQTYILSPLYCFSKKRLFEEISALASSITGQEETTLMRALNNRESWGSTMSTNSVGLPHAVIPELKQSLMIVAILPNDIPYNTVDSDYEGVNLAFAFFFSTEDDYEIDAEMLRLFSSALRNPDLANSFRRIWQDQGKLTRLIQKVDKIIFKDLFPERYAQEQAEAKAKAEADRLAEASANALRLFAEQQAEEEALRKREEEAHAAEAAETEEAEAEAEAQAEDKESTPDQAEGEQATHGEAQDEIPATQENASANAQGTTTTDAPLDVDAPQDVITENETQVESPAAMQKESSAQADDSKKAPDIVQTEPHNDTETCASETTEAPEPETTTVTPPETASNASAAATSPALTPSTEPLPQASEDQTNLRREQKE